MFRQSVTRHERNILWWCNFLFTTRHCTKESRVVRIKTKEDDIVFHIGRHYLNKDRSRFKEVGVLRTKELIYLSTLFLIWQNWVSKGNPPSELVPVRMRDFVKLARRAVTAKTYDWAEEALKLLKAVPITTENAFTISKEALTKIDGKFVKYELADHDDPIVHLEEVEEMSILSRLVWVNVKKKKGEREPLGFKFKFHEIILEQLLHSQSLPFNHQALTGLKQEASILCYGHLDTVMAGSRNSIYRSYSKRLFKQISMEGTRNAKKGKRKSMLDRVKQELEGIAISTGIIRSMRIEWMEKEKDWLVTFKKTSFQHINMSKDLKMETNSVVQEALKIINETNNAVTKGYLFKKCRELGADRVRQCVRIVKTDFY